MKKTYLWGNLMACMGEHRSGQVGNRWVTVGYTTVCLYPPSGWFPQLKEQEAVRPSYVQIWWGGYVKGLQYWSQKVSETREKKKKCGSNDKMDMLWNNNLILWSIFSFSWSAKAATITLSYTDNNNKQIDPLMQICLYEENPTLQCIVAVKDNLSSRRIHFTQ